MESLTTPTVPQGPVVSKWTFSPQKKKIASAVAAVAVLGTTAAVIASNSGVNTDFKSATTGAGGCSGVAYDSYQAGDVDKHFAVIKTKFTNVRTYQTLVEGTSRGSVNLIDAGAKAGLGMACGLWLRMGDPGFFDRDLKALVDGIKRNPGTCQQVYVGNEDLFAGLDKGTVMARISTTKSALAAAGIRVPVGTVQTDASMKDPANADLAAMCDVIGINVYPYSTGASISQLTIRFNEVAKKYPGKVRLTETGWPSAGNSIATYDNAKKYFMDYQQWKNTEGGECPYYFQFHDVKVKHGDEANFGLSADGYTWKFDVAPAPTTPPPTTTPAPTPAPTTVTPAPTTVTPEPTTTEVTTPSPTNSTNSSLHNVTETLVNNSTNATEANTTTINSPDGIENTVPSDSESTTAGNTDAATPTGGSSSTTEVKDTKVNTSAQEEESTSTGTYIISILSGMVGVAAVAAVIMFAVRNRRRIEEEKENDFNTGDFFVDTNRGSELSNWPRSGSVAVL